MREMKDDVTLNLFRLLCVNLYNIIMGFIDLQLLIHLQCNPKKKTTK